MNASTVPTVKQAFVDVLKARPALAGIQINYAHPGSDRVKAESIFMGRTRGRHEIASMRAGRKHRDEEYAFDAWISVARVSSAIDEAELRAFELLAELESALADEPRLGLPATTLEWAKAGDFESTSGFGEERETVSEIRLQVECRARLT